MGYILDSHAHYDDRAFDGDRDKILNSLKDEGVGIVVNASARVIDIKKIIELTRQYDFLYGMAGLHPTELYSEESAPLVQKIRGSEDEEEVKRLSRQLTGPSEAEYRIVEDALKEKKIVAVGEIGLDYHYEDTDKALQKEWFEKQIDLAQKYKYPISVHSRDAASDTLDIIKASNARDIGGVIHCFSYEKEMAKIYLDLGFYLGIGGVVTYKNSRKLKEVVQYAPLDRLLLETDCPYLSPVPLRGSRNDSGNIKYIAAEIAGIKNLPVQTVIDMTEASGMKMYKIGSVLH